MPGGGGGPLCNEDFVTCSTTQRRADDRIQTRKLLVISQTPYMEPKNG